MASATIEILGGALSRVSEGVSATPLPLERALEQFSDWTRRYDRAVTANRDDDLAVIGREMFLWLDADGWASAWEGELGDLELEIRAGPRDDRREAILLDAPWELLAGNAGFLAQDPVRLFVVSRRIGSGGGTRPASHGDVRLMFMAAAPEGPSVLDFEAEEAAILEATSGDGNIQLVVEETGTLVELGRQLAAGTAGFEALHVSCHGDVDERGSYLLLETAEGQPERVYAEDLVEAFGPVAPPLVMLSACRTAERELTTPFVRRLAVVVANVVGWGGSVFDEDAVTFAARFYAELGRRSPVARAAAYGRRELIRRLGSKPYADRHWHLARVYLGPGGGGALCDGSMPARRPTIDLGPRAFLDKARQRIPVASPDAFVGRRRALQAILRALRTHEPGILIHGMGAIGKSSAAARVASRLPLKPCVIFEHYDALAICDAVIEVLPPTERREARAVWRAGVVADPENLADALEAWLEGPLDQAPILLIIDDLEQILMTPSAGDVVTSVAPYFQAPLAAVLKAFAKAQTSSRLLITSRYDFALPDARGRDGARHLKRLALAPMPVGERIKQLRAAQRLVGNVVAETGEEASELIDRTLTAAGGNPGLQAILTAPILRGETAVAAEALGQVETYLKTGAPAAEIQGLIDRGIAKDHANALVAFFARLSFATYREALTDDEARLLSAATLFSDQLPVPADALVLTGKTYRCRWPQEGLARLFGLGLLDNWGVLPEVPHFAVNSLARPLAAPLTPRSRRRLARKVTPLLVTAWREMVEGRPVMRTDSRAVEAAMLAMEGRVAPELIEETATAAAAWFDRNQRRTRDAFDIVMAANAHLPRRHRAGAQFVRVGIECANRLGEVEAFGALIERRRSRPTSDPADRLAHAQLDIRISEHLTEQGDVARAEALLANVVKIARGEGDKKTELFAQSRIVTIHYVRGDYDAASRILVDELLKGYEQLDDSLGKADTLAEIARIHLRRGELDESLRMQREEILPIYRRLGDERSCAVTMGAIADVLELRGDYAEVLRIRREDELPVYERLGAARERILTLDQIATLLEQTGDLEQAVRIRRDEVIPAYARLGDRRAWAIAQGNLARILAALDQDDEALRIREEDELPVYLETGDTRMAALCRMQMTDLLWGNGREEEALAMLRDQALPVFEQQGDQHAIASALGRLAKFLTERGELTEALAILRDRALPICERMGLERQRAHTLGLIAETLFQQGFHKEAVRILREEELPIHERLGDLRSHRITTKNLESMLREMAGTE